LELLFKNASLQCAAVDENLSIVLQSFDREAMERLAAHPHHSDQNIIIMVCLLIAPYHNYYDGDVFSYFICLGFLLDRQLLLQEVDY
jgi:hypothetical protein